MQRYGVIYADIWLDEEFKRLPPTAKLVYAYLLSSPHSNMAGYFRLPVAYACEDLRLQENDYMDAIRNLEKSGFILSNSSDVVLVRTYLKYNKIANEKQAKGVWNQVERIPIGQLTVEFAHACILYAQNVIQFFDAKTIRYLKDVHMTVNHIDIAPRLAFLRNDYRLLMNLTGTESDSETDTDTDSDTESYRDGFDTV